MTTQWQSMFDGGPCNVSAASNVSWPAYLWYGALGLGESSPQFVAFGANYQITVDANGVVSLVSPDNSGNAPGMMITVEPQYDTSSLQTQIAAIFAQPAQTPPVYASNDGDALAGAGTVIAIDGAGAGTPASITFAPAAYPAPSIAMAAIP